MACCRTAKKTWPICRRMVRGYRLGSHRQQKGTAWYARLTGKLLHTETVPQCRTGPNPCMVPLLVLYCLLWPQGIRRR
jgi:hypothetical protein